MKRLNLKGTHFPLKFDLRSTVLVLAVLLGIHTVWVLTAELARPNIAEDSRFPIIVPAQDINWVRMTSDAAASIGLIRGDLWSERVLVDASNILTYRAAAPTSLTPQEALAAMSAAERALSCRPINSRIWLAIAALSSGVAAQHAKSNEQLKMSYYTGPNDKSVMAHRLKSIVRFQALDDLDLREAVRREIRTILLRVPELRPTVMAAYLEAQPQDREFFETAVSATDPNFAAALRAARPK